MPCDTVDNVGPETTTEGARKILTQLARHNSTVWPSRTNNLCGSIQSRAVAKINFDARVRGLSALMHVFGLSPPSAPSRNLLDPSNMHVKPRTTAQRD